MAATNDFKTFASAAGANVLSQPQYLTMTALPTGFQTGIAQSNQVNKVLRQSSLISSMIAQFICDQTGQNAIDDGTIATLEANFIAALMSTYRVKLANPLSLFVSPSGSDSNTGLTSSSPFQTLQKAATIAQNNYDTQGLTITINMAPGTYTVGASLTGQPLGGGQIKFLGNTANPLSCNVGLTGPGACFSATNGARVIVSGVAMSAATGSSNVGAIAGNCLSGSTGATILFDHTFFGVAQAAQIFAGNGALLSATGPYTVQGNAQYHMAVGVGAQIYIAGQAITIQGTPIFSNAFAWADAAGEIYANQASFAGTTSGQRYLTTNGGVISTGSGGANFFPGSVAGNSSAGYYT